MSTATADAVRCRAALSAIRDAVESAEARLARARADVDAKEDAVARLRSKAARRAKDADADERQQPPRLQHVERPRRGIGSQADLERFLASGTATELVRFLAALSDGARAPAASPVEEEDATPAVLAALSALDRLLDETPPETSLAGDVSGGLPGDRQRFGNRAFRSWHAKVEAAAAGGLLAPVASRCAPLATDADAHARAASAELAAYWTHAFGDPTRLDYGTGHEAAFLMSLYVLHRRGAVRDPARLALVVFPAYLALARRARKLYRLEPAGSHGVWSLDDYHFFPFVLGSAQLAAARACTPRALLRGVPASLGPGGELPLPPHNLLVDALRDILESKRGPFREHSPMLYELGAMRSWDEVAAGLMRMWRGEVLGKLPVAQHFWFGPSLPVTWRSEPVGTSTMAGGPALTTTAAPAYHDPLAKYFSLTVKPLAGPSAAAATSAQTDEGRSVQYVVRADGSGVDVASEGWTIEAVADSKIASEAELDELRARTGLDFPLPEMVFARNSFRGAHERSGVRFSFSVEPALAGCRLEPGEAPDRTLIKVAMAEAWAKRMDADGNAIKTWREDYDWTFTTHYGGDFSRGGRPVAPKVASRGIDYELLKRREPILWSKAVVFYEDDLFDMGLAKLSLRVRVMPSCFFVLARLFVRVDRVFYRAFDTRVYHAFGAKVVLVESSRREAAFDEAAHAAFKADDSDALVQSMPLLEPAKTTEAALS